MIRSKFYGQSEVAEELQFKWLTPEQKLVAAARELEIKVFRLAYV